MSTAFSLLGTGIRFDKKRFAQDFEVFGKKPVKKALISQGDDDSTDFFAQQQAKSATNDIAASTTADIETSINDVIEAAEEDISEFSSVEDLNVFRKQNFIKVYGSEVPAPIRSFKHLEVRHSYPRGVLHKVGLADLDKPTPVQMQAIPVMLAGRDLISCAPTGSGKTMAFVLPLLFKKHECEGIKSVIVAPTRELAQQIQREIVKVAPKIFKVALLSKSNVAHPSKNYDVLISTPLRLVHAIKDKQVDLATVKTLIIDEADKLFDMGFLSQIDEIVAACTLPTLQKCLFSATIDSHVETLAGSIMKEPIRIVIGQKNAVAHEVEQKLLFVGQEEGKIIAIRELLRNGIKPPVLIFVDSIERAKELCQALVLDYKHVDMIHSERTEGERDEIIKNYRSGKIWILIATEILGRGLDFKGINLVINYDFPKTLASYIHRIGRTGRAGRPGKAITYFCREDSSHLRSIANVMKESGCEIDDWMLALPKQQKWKQKKRAKYIKKKPAAEAKSL